MENEETKRETPGWKRRDSNSAFLHSMSEAVSGCERLATAIDNHDFEGVELAARHSASMWLAAYAAHWRIIDRGESIPLTDRTSALLEARTTLLDLFTHAKGKIAVLRMHRLLDELRESLVTAEAESAADGAHRS